MEKLYTLQLTVTNTEGWLARSLRDSVFTGKISIQADADNFTNNYGMVLISGCIDKRDGQKIELITFSECVFLYSSKLEYSKDNENGSFSVEAILENGIIKDVKIKILNKGISSIFLVKLIELNGFGTETT